MRHYYIETCLKDYSTVRADTFIFNGEFVIFKIGSENVAAFPAGEIHSIQSKEVITDV